MSVTIPSLSDVTDILDTDMVMVTQSGGQTYKISGADLNKRNQAVIANSTTLTGAPLKTGNIVRVHFTADITGVNTTTALSLSYNGTSKTVKVPKDGALANFTAQNMGGTPTVYKYLQAYTTLELLYDGTQFVIIGNPVVLSSSNYSIFADGLRREDAVTWSSKNMVTSGSVASTCLTKDSIPRNYFTNGQDLNSITNGIMAALNDTIGNSLLHVPIASPASCVLIALNNGGNTVYQLFIDGRGQLYSRVSWNGGSVWQNWRTYTNT